MSQLLNTLIADEAYWTNQYEKARRQKKSTRNALAWLTDLTKEISAERERIKNAWDGYPIYIRHFDYISPRGTKQENIVLPRDWYNISGSIVYLTTEDGRDVMKFGSIQPTIHDLTDASTYPDTTVGAILANLTPQHEGRNPWSDWDTAHLANVKIRLLTDQELANLLNQFTTLIYPMKCIGDAKDWNPNPGYCMIDFIIKSFIHYGKALTRVQLIEELGGEDAIKDGVSVKHLDKWIRHRHYDNVSIYALDAFGKAFYTHISKDCRVMLCFIVNNKHVYPIEDDAVRLNIARSKRLVMSEFAFITDWSNMCTWDVSYNNEDEDEIIITTIPNTAPTVLVETNCLKKLAMAITKQTNKIVQNCIIPDGEHGYVTRFEHPVTKQHVVAAEEWKIRKPILERLEAETKYLGFRWMNQSYSKIGRCIFEWNYGKLIPSSYGPEQLLMYAKSRLGPLTKQSTLCIDKIEDCSSIDTCRTYTKMMIDNIYPYPIYLKNDDYEVWDGKWVTGEYFISKRPQILDKQELGVDTYPLPLAKYLVDNKHIDVKYVTHVHASRQAHPANLFKDFAEKTTRKFPKESKNIINHFIGYLGRRCEKRTQGCVTDEWDIACGLHKEYKGAINIEEMGGLAFITKHTETPLATGHVPIWRHIIALGIVNMLEMYKKLVGPNSSFKSCKTDSIQVERPLPYTVGTNPGDLRKETHFDICQRVSPVVDGWIPVDIKWKYLTKEEAIKSDGCSFQGGGGCGKSYTLDEMAELVDNKLILGYTVRSTEIHNLKNAKLKAITLDAAFPKGVPDKQWLNTYKNKKAVFVDEDSMIQLQHWNKLWNLKFYNKPKMFFFGDYNQTASFVIKEDEYMRFAYQDSALLYYSCNGNRCILPYWGQRYDEITHNKLTILKTTGTVDWGDKTEWKNCQFTLCKEPSTRTRINMEMFEYYREDNKLVMINDVAYYVGLPLIAYQGDKKLHITNSHWFVIEEITNDTVIVYNKTEKCIDVKCERCKNDDYCKNRRRTIPNARITMLMRWGFADTITRVQGAPLPFRYNIVDLDKMTRNDIDTAIGRTTKWDDIGVNPMLSQKIYMPVKIAKSCRMMKTEELGEIDDEIWVHKDDNCYIVVGREPKGKCIWKGFGTKKQVDELIDDITRQMQKTVRVKEAKEEKKEVKITFIDTKYEIINNEAKKMLILRWGNERKNWRYVNCGLEAAMKEAMEFRASLLKKMYY